MSRDPRRPIGIWRPDRIDGKPVWVRPEPGPFPDHHATRRVLHLERKRPRRLCFFGESAAAGYLLAPHVTPAQVLERRLGPRWEVLDFSRTNERIASLVETLEASLQLEPDVLVVFTGNNWNLLETPTWSPFYPDPGARRRFAASVRTRGLTGPVLETRRIVSDRARGLFRALTAAGTRTVVVIPEINLRDWDTRDPVPWMPAGVHRWHGLHIRAERALDGGRAERARTAARTLLELDGGVSPTGYDLLARASLRLGRTDEAELAARAAADSTHAPLLGLLAAPRARPFDQALLKEGARTNGLEAVDLRAVFSESFGPLVGREAFYDYCHLTPGGIDVAMTAVAAQVDEVFDETELRVPGEVRARASLGAALHGAHRGARGEILRHWIRSALQEDEGTRARLDDVIEARRAGVPAVFTSGQRRDMPLTPQQGWRWPHLDAEILSTIRHVTDGAVEPRHPGLARIELWNPLDRFLPDVLDHADSEGTTILRAPWPRTDLALFAHGPCLVEIVLRGSGRARLGLRGRVVANTILRGEWSRWRIALDVEPGLHRLTLRWSLSGLLDGGGLGSALDDLAEGLECPIHPVFGEIYDMRLVDGDRPR